MVELVDTRDLKSLGHRLCRFKPGSGYQKAKAATGQILWPLLLFRHRNGDPLLPSFWRKSDVLVNLDLENAVNLDAENFQVLTIEYFTFLTFAIKVLGIITYYVGTCGDSTDNPACRSRAQQHNNARRTTRSEAT